MTDPLEQVATAYLRRIADNCSGVAFLGDSTGRLVRISPWFYEYTGLNPASARTSAIVRTAHPDDRARLLRDWRCALSTGAPFRAAFRLRRRDGDWEWFRCHGRLMGSLTDDQRQWFGICIRVEDLAAMQLAGFDRLAANLPVASHALARAGVGDTLTNGALAGAGASGLNVDEEGSADADSSEVRLTAAASYALAAALLIEDGSAAALSKAQGVLNQLSRELVQLSHDRTRRRRRAD